MNKFFEGFFSVFNSYTTGELFGILVVGFILGVIVLFFVGLMVLVSEKKWSVK